MFSALTFTGKYLLSPEKSLKNVASFVVAISMQVRLTSVENLSYGSLTVLILADIKSLASSALFAFLRATLYCNFSDKITDCILALYII